MVTFGFTGSGFTSTGFTAPIESTKTYTIDVVFKKINMSNSNTKYTIDSSFKKVGQFKTYLMNAIFALIRSKTYSIDAAFALRHIGSTYTQDVAFKKLNLVYPQPGTGGFTNSGFTQTGFTIWTGYTQYTMDSVFDKAIIGARYVLISVFKKAGIPQTYTMDSIFVKIGKHLIYTMDAILKKVGIHNNYLMDAILKKVGIHKNYTIDAAFAHRTTVTYTMDSVFVASLFQFVFGTSITMMQPIGDSITQQNVIGTSITQ